MRCAAPAAPAAQQVRLAVGSVPAHARARSQASLLVLRPERVRREWYRRDKWGRLSSVARALPAGG